jgi:hypothetical protein
MSFEIKEIKIKFYTNLQDKEKKLVDFDLDMLYHELKSAPNEKGETSVEQLKKDGLNKLPFFTISLKYPLSRLQKDLLSYQERIGFFFDEKEFEKRLFLYSTGPNESDDVDLNNSIAEHNIMVMIELLFPTKFNVINNFHTSMDHVFGKSYLKRMLINPTITKYYSYLKLNDGKIYTFTRLIWLNDILNHPLYRTLIKEFHIFWLWYIREKNKLIKQMIVVINDISKKIDSIIIKIIQAISQSYRYYSLQDDYHDINLSISDQALSLLSKMVRFKNVIDTLKTTDVLSFERILKLARFNLNDVTEKYFYDNIEGLINETIQNFKGEEEKKNLLIKFDDIEVEDEFSKYKKISEYITIYFTKEEIDKIDISNFLKPQDEKELTVEEKAKNKAAQEKLKEEDKDFKMPEQIKPFLNKIKSELSVLISNPMRIPFENFQRLQIYITKPLNEVESANKTLNTEYATFMRNVRSRYYGAQRKSINAYLQNLVDSADENNATEFFKLFSTIYSMYMLGKKPKMNMELDEQIRNVMNTGITKINTNVQNWQYEIYIMADFIQGKVDDENANKIFCPYVGEYLGTLFDFLFQLSLYGKDEKDDTMRWAVDRNRVFFSLEQIKSKTGETQQQLSQKPLSSSVLAQKSDDTNKMSKFNSSLIINAGEEEVLSKDIDRINTLFIQNVISADKDILDILTNLKQYISDIDESRLLSYIYENNKELYKLIIKWHDNQYTRNEQLLESMIGFKSIIAGENDKIKQRLTDPNYIRESTEKISLRAQAELNNLYLKTLDKLIELEKQKATDMNPTRLRPIMGGTKKYNKKKHLKTRKFRNIL